MTQPDAELEKALAGLAAPAGNGAGNGGFDPMETARIISAAAKSIPPLKHQDLEMGLDDWAERLAGQTPEDIAHSIAETIDLITPVCDDAGAEIKAALTRAGLLPPESPTDRVFIDWSTFWIEDDQPEWAYPDILAWGRGHALYAAHKAGKSLLMLFIAAKVATETDHHVTYVDYEMTERDVRDRLSEMGYGPESDLSRLHYALLPKMPPLDTEAGGQALMDLLDVAAVGAPDAHSVVVIDTISRAVVGEENDADTWRFFYLYTGMRLKRRGCTWVRLDHAGKDADRGQRGSSSKGDDVDIVWKLIATQNGIKLTRELSRMGWVPEEVVLLKKESPYLHYLRATSDVPEGTLELVQMLDSLGVSGDCTNAQARKALRQAGCAAANKAVAACVRWRQMAFRESAERRPSFRERTEAWDGSEQDEYSYGTDCGTARNDAHGHSAEQCPPLVEGGTVRSPTSDLSIGMGDMP